MQNVNKIQSLLSLAFNSLFTEHDDILFVNLDFLTDRNYQAQGVNEYLYIINQLGKNKIIVFLLRDGINPYLTGIVTLIEKTIQMHNLNKETCFIYGYHRLTITNATTILVNYAKVWIRQIYPLIQDLPLATTQFEKTFAALFGRHDPYRLKLFRHLNDNYANTSILSYNSNTARWNHRFDEYFIDDRAYFETNCPKLLDYANPRGWVPYQDSMQDIGKHYQQYFIEIVAETDPHTNNFFTEKTTKNFYLGKPFLLLSGQHSLKYLQDLGFCTFAPWINEDYDNMPGIADRVQAIQVEIDRLGQLSKLELKQIHQGLHPIFEHNRQVFLDISRTPVELTIG
jgi:hypothetical protein